MSTTLRKAMIELDRLGTSTDDTGRKAVEELLSTLVGMRDIDSHTARQWVVDMFSRLANHEVLSPLTGGSEEWSEIPPKQRFSNFTYQNNRETSVFADAVWVNEGTPNQEWNVRDAIDSQGLRIMRGTEDSGWVTWVPVVFPYMPQRYQFDVGLADTRSDDEVEEWARQMAQERGQVVFGGRTDGGK